jgi:hypothetical protein
MLAIRRQTAYAEKYGGAETEEQGKRSQASYL